jgi:hypothetical protein
MLNVHSFHFIRRTIRTATIGITLLFLASAATAQFEPASPPIANPSDTRFKEVTEQLDTPSLTGTKLLPIHPIYMPNDMHDYTLDFVQVQWRWGDPVDLYVIKPKGVKNPPVILYLFSYPNDTDVFKDPAFAKTVTKDGFAAVGFVAALTGQRYHDVPMKQWFVSELQQCMAMSAHDVQMIINYLATRGDLDTSKVGMFGQGSGGSIAILASAVDSRIKVLDVLNPWGDWPTWMAVSPFVPENERKDYVTPEFLKKAASVEPVDWLPKVQAKQFRLQDVIFDTSITPAAARDKLRAAAPASTTFAIYKTEADFKAAFPQNGMNLTWMEEALRKLPAESTPSASPPNATAAQ